MFPTVDISITNLTPEGGFTFDGPFTTGAVVQTKVVSNPLKRQRTTFYCLSDQNGTWVLYDVDRKGRRAQIASIPVTANTLSIYTHEHIMEYAWSTFAPGDFPGNLIIRVIPGGGGGSP